MNLPGLHRLLNKHKPHLAFLVVLLSLSACQKGPQEEMVVYTNDFETNNLAQIDTGLIASFNDTQVLGRYNKSGFSLRLNDLPRHDLVKISFDLYIHDSWDGNGAAPDGPDLWSLEVDGVSYIRTTFSNNDCFWCLPQSYPFNYPNNNQVPKTGAVIPSLASVCPSNNPKGTSMYRIVKTVRHEANTLSVRCFDELIQSNVADQLCDESWSVDNLVITTTNLD